MVTTHCGAPTANCGGEQAHNIGALAQHIIPSTLDLASKLTSTQSSQSSSSSSSGLATLLNAKPLPRPPNLVFGIALAGDHGGKKQVGGGSSLGAGRKRRFDVISSTIPINNNANAGQKAPSLGATKKGGGAFALSAIKKVGVAKKIEVVDQLVEEGEDEEEEGVNAKGGGEGEAI
jgi:hypothetical protein